MRTHAVGLPACDFFTMETVRRQTLSGLFFLEVQTRRVFIADHPEHPVAPLDPRVWASAQGDAELLPQEQVLEHERLAA